MNCHHHPRPADRRIALGHIRGLSARAIGDRLELPTEYVEMRLPKVIDMPIVAPPMRSNISNRLLAVLADAEGEPVRIDCLMAVYPENEDANIPTIRTKLCDLRKQGHRIASSRLLEMVRKPRDVSSSRVMTELTRRLSQGMATTQALSEATGIPVFRIRVYLTKLRKRGAEIVLHTTYTLEPSERPS